MKMQYFHSKTKHKNTGYTFYVLSDILYHIVPLFIQLDFGLELLDK